MSRKTSYIIRIVIWAVIGLLSVGILVSAIVVGSFSEVIHKAFDWRGKSMEIINESTFNSKDIENINIKWIDGTINIYPGQEDYIKIIEKKKGKIKEEDILDVNIKDQTLYIKQKDKKGKFTFFNFGINRRIVRDIILPKKIYQEFNVKGTSGKLNIENIQTKEFNLNLTSGKVKVDNVSGQNLTTGVTSGSINIVGTFETLDMDVTSGLLVIDLNKAPSKMTVRVMSGKTSISIPDNQGFSLYETKSSGAFKNDFELDDFGVYKNGEYKYSIKISSGLVKLLKKSE